MRAGRGLSLKKSQLYSNDLSFFLFLKNKICMELENLMNNKSVLNIVYIEYDKNKSKSLI